MTLPVTLTVESDPEADYKFVYSSTEPILRSVGGIAEILVPSGLQMLSFTLESNVAGATATFIDQPVVWLNDAGELRGTPPGMSPGRLSGTELVITVNNTNEGPGEIPVPFFLIVLLTGPGATDIRIIGRDPILIEEPPGN
jgi:hypothetical protein